MARCDDTDLELEWKAMTVADLFRLLRQVESSWKNLAKELLKERLHFRIATIESNCFHNNTIIKAIDDVFDKWLQCTKRDKRKWKTLCDAAAECGDDSLTDYVKDPENGLEENGEPSMKHLQRWSKDSVLRIDWEDLSLKLIGKAKTRIIKATHFMGGDSACMRELLNTWWESTTEQNHSWQVIVDALGHVDGTAKVIENIEDEFKIRRS